MYRSILLAALTAAVTPLAAQQPVSSQVASTTITLDTANPHARKSLRAVRVDGAPPTIDGRLDEAVWLLAPAGTDFVQTQPNPGAAATEQTEIRFAYDDDALYVGARMYDSRPDSIV